MVVERAALSPPGSLQRPGVRHGRGIPGSAPRPVENRPLARPSRD